jgi:hypothetical protein
MRLRVGDLTVGQTAFKVALSKMNKHEKICSDNQGRPLGQANKATALGSIEICFYQRKRGLPKKKKKPPNVKKEIRFMVLRA